jgi:hypothetical protein
VYPQAPCALRVLPERADGPRERLRVHHHGEDEGVAESNGYAFQIEMSFRAWKKGFRLGEIPIMFVDRDVGESKMSK